MRIRYKDGIEHNIRSGDSGSYLLRCPIYVIEIGVFVMAAGTLVMALKMGRMEEL